MHNCFLFVLLHNKWIKIFDEPHIQHNGSSIHAKQIAHSYFFHCIMGFFAKCSCTFAGKDVLYAFDCIYYAFCCFILKFPVYYLTKLIKMNYTYNLSSHWRLNYMYNWFLLALLNNKWIKIFDEMHMQQNGSSKHAKQIAPSYSFHCIMGFFRSCFVCLQGRGCIICFRYIYYAFCYFILKYA